MQIIGDCLMHVYPAEIINGTVSIPSNVKAITIGAFSGLDDLTNIMLPQNVEFIESYTFDHCKNLKSIIFASSKNYNRR